MTRFAGSLHIRGLPPAIEGGQGNEDQFNEFFGQLVNGPIATDFWTCASSAVGDTTRVESGYGYGIHEAPKSLFVATDSKGLCEKAQRLWQLEPAGGYAKEYTIGGAVGDALAAEGITNVRAPLSCFDMDPVHLAKTDVASMSDNHHEVFDELHAHQTVVLEWYLLSRSRFLYGMTRMVSARVGSG